MKAETLLPLLAALLALAGLMYYRPIQKKKEEEQLRRRLAEADYPELVTTLSLLLTAGLSLRNSWHKMVEDYRESCRAGAPPRPAYEEMDRTARELLAGVFEDKAYGDFGRRLGGPQYLHLGSLLETYVLEGNRDLPRLLEQEAADSRRLRLQQVKVRGEKTGALLLLPTVLLLGITLLLVTVPAFLQLKGSL